MISPDRSTPPEIRDFGQLTIPPISKILLPQGIAVNVVKTGESPANRVGLLWNYGTSRNSSSTATSLVPAMLLQGSKTLTAEQIVDRTDFLGVFMSNNVNASYTRFEVLSLNEVTGRFLDLLADVVLNPVFPEDRFEALIRKTLAKYVLNMSRTNYVAREELNKLIAGEDHPYLVPATREEIQATTVDDVRNAWREGVYHSDMQIFASGDITPELQSRMIEFAHLLRPDEVKLSYITPVPYSPAEPGLRKIEMADASQSSIAMGIPTIPRTHPDYIALRITVMALGGYFGSRLMTNIREEKGLTYGITASLMGTHEGAMINVTADCDASYVDRVLDEIRKEMEALATKPMDTDELARLRSYYMTGIASTLESFKTIGEYYENRLTVGLPDHYFDDQQTVLRNITPEQIRDIAAKYFNIEDAITVVAGK